MSLRVELYRSDDYVPYGEVDLVPLLLKFFEPLIGESLEGTKLRLDFLPVDDASLLPGTPSLINLRAHYGYVRVSISREETLLYQHPHPVREIIGAQLRTLLTKADPAEAHWGFGIRGPGMDQVALVRPAPEVTHGLTLRNGSSRVPVFQLEEVDGPEPAEATLTGLGADVPADDNPRQYPVSVLVAEPLRRGFLAAIPFSHEVEEGGFLAGRVYRQAGTKNFIIEITTVFQAERTGASMLHFTFTGESFLRVNEQLHARQRDEQLLGWYHTHLFSASDALGLSSVDANLHRSTFLRPWQVAALINIGSDGRMLRFYRGDGESMALAPYWGVDR